MGAGADSLKYRFQWTFPVEISPHDDDTLYICSNFVHRSTDDGTSWETISPDLTRNDPSKIGSSGGPITADNSGAEIYCTIFAFRESPHERGVFWAGSDDGLMHISRDGGKSWENVTPPDLPGVGDDQHHRALAARRGHGLRRGHLLQVRRHDALSVPDDRLRRDLDADHRRHPGRRVHPRHPRGPGPARAAVLRHRDAASTSRSTTAWPGSGWRRICPITPIWDLVVKGTDLVAATHGRSFWILDDITPLHQLHDDLASEPAHLFKPRDTVRFRLYGRAFEGKAPGYSTTR